MHQLSTAVTDTYDKGKELILLTIPQALAPSHLATCVALGQ